MRRLLAVITRMYALRGGDHDEFVAAWGGAENEEFIIFPKENGIRERVMLLIHGYDYPRVPTDVSILRAGSSVASGLKDNELIVSDCEVGLLFHPPLTWGASAKDHFVEKVLNSAGKVNFVREYRSASRLVKELAPMVKTATQKADAAGAFHGEFDKVWQEYRSNLSRYDSRFGLLVTQIDTCVMPFINRLDRWRKFGLDANRAGEMLEFHQTSMSAIEKALDTNGIHGAVNRIVNSLILETRSRTKLESIEKGFQEVEDFLGNKQGAFVEMHETIELFKSAGDPPDPDVLNQIASKLKNSNPIRVWYAELLEKMSRLRRALLVPDV